MRIRTIFFWTHVAAALVAGAIVVVMAGTGVLLSFERQITAWADMRGVDVRVQSGARLSPVVLAERAAEVAPTRITALRFHADPATPVEAFAGRDAVLLMDPWTGAMLGRGSAQARAFFDGVEGWHRWLALDGDARRAGRAITGAANLVFLCTILTGALLWWPRNRTRAAFRNALLPRRGLRVKARHFSWHNVAGSWSALPLLVIVATGAVISYAWAAGLVLRMSGTEQSAPVVVATATDSADIGSAALLERAIALAGEWRTITMQLPPRNGAWTFVIDASSGGRPQKQAELRLAPSGEVLLLQTHHERPRADRIRNIMRYAHTGEVFGVVGQAVAGLVSAATMLLAWTGASLLLRRFRAWRARRAAQAGLPTTRTSLR